MSKLRYLVTLALGLSACAAGKSAELKAPRQPVWAPAPRPQPSAPVASCPTAEQVTMDSQETRDDIALIFSTERGDVKQLRAEVRLMADRINRGGPLEPFPLGERAPALQPAAGEETVQALATVEPIEGGARLVLSAIDPTQEEQLREQVRSYVLATTRCPAVGG